MNLCVAIPGTCKLFEGPRRIRSSKYTIFAGAVCYVIHAKTWCLATTLFEDVGKVGFQAAVLRLKATNHFTSVFENTKMLTGFELSSNELDDPAMVVSREW